jgi:hypothetical protein
VKTYLHLKEAGEAALSRESLQLKEEINAYRHIHLTAAYHKVLD